MEEVRSGRRPFTILDVLHRESLEKLVERYRIAGLSEAAIIERVRAEAAELLPAARAEHLTRATVHHIPMAVHAPLPGTERLRPSANSPLPGLVLAGDWTRTDWNIGCIEAAAVSGLGAARAVR